MLMSDYIRQDAVLIQTYKLQHRWDEKIVTGY